MVHQQQPAAALLLAVHLACSTAVTMAVRGTPGTGNRWGNMPEHIDIARSITLNTQASQTFDEEHTPWIEQVGSKPKVYIFHNFLTNAERTHMIRIAAPQMRRSTVVGPRGESVVDDIRTSYGMFIKRLHDPIITNIEKRISLFTHLPVSHQEDIQVLRYTDGQNYGAHYDSGTGSEPGPHHRLATLLMYLSNVEEGGETAFPNNSEWVDPDLPAKLEAQGMKFSKCAQGHVSYKPKAGDAVLFYSFHPNGTMDDASMHTGCPVIKGIKWAAPVWIHFDEYSAADWAFVQRAKPNRVEFPKEPGLCDDVHPQCHEWSQKGECQRNPGFMLGDSNGGGACRKSCGSCRVCNNGDISCINENRRKAGYLPLDRAEMEGLGVQWWLGEEPSPEL